MSVGAVAVVVAVVEVVFSIPGLGADLVTGLRRLDTSLIVGVGLTLSPYTAFSALVFLVVLRVLESLRSRSRRGLTRP